MMGQTRTKASVAATALVAIVLGTIVASWYCVTLALRRRRCTTIVPNSIALLILTNGGASAKNVDRSTVPQRGTVPLKIRHVT